ncbi:MAG TPA: NAD-dependent epimerase/dehydratase family protein [Chroococcidiopsis sp.]
MHFIVTGGAGFIGSHLTEQLLCDGHQVTVVDNLSTGKSENLPVSNQLKFLEKDILQCQPSDFTTPVDGIAHLAAMPSVTESWEQPMTAHHCNLSATVAVIQLCQSLHIPRLVFTSSAAVYGNPIQLPITEEHPTRPISPYGLQKLSSEHYVSLFAQQIGFSAVNLRLFNVFGPRQNPNSQYSGVISIFTRLMRQENAISLYGDGSQTRDFVYVKDVAIAFAKSLTASLEPGTHAVCNIGTGQSVTLVQLIDSLRDCFPEWGESINYLPARLGDIQHSRADVTTAAMLLDFKASWSLSDGLRSLVDFSTVNH